MADKMSKMVLPVKSGDKITNKEFEFGDNDDLGTAAYKDVPTSGNASSSQVVMGNDSRLSDSRNAKDVPSWAKASSKPTYTASEVGAIATSAKGAANGVAELDSTGKVPSSQLPSYVDDVLEYDSLSAFPSTGETGKIYVAKDTNKSYRWTGSAYSQIKGDLALGETSSTAYRGDRGKTAYDHSQSTHARTDATKTEASSTNGNIKINGTETNVYTHPGSGTNPHGTTKSDVGLGNVGNFKAVSTVASQGLSDTEKANARANIGAGTSSSDTKVTQTATTTSADYEVLFSSTADNTTRTEGARKNSNLKFNPSTGNLQATKLNGVDIGTSPKFTDTNTWRGIQDNLTSDSSSDSLSAKQGKALKDLIDDLETTFQAGVDDVYDAVVAKGSTPASKSLSDVVQGIENIPTGGNKYKSVNATPVISCVDGDTWSVKTWSDLPSFYKSSIWTDGTNIYYSNASKQYVLDKATSTWSTKSWSGQNSIYGDQIWTDGENIYYSYGSSQYVLDKETSTWSKKTWNGLKDIDGEYIWTDGENIYYSDNSKQYVLNKATSTWSTKSWSGLTSLYRGYIWSDGENVYYSNGSNQQYVLNKATSTWSTKSWSGTLPLGNHIWTDGDNIYHSSGSSQYVLNKATSTWSAKTWSGLTSLYGSYIWTDGDNIYHSGGSSQYVLELKKTTAKSQPVLN